MSFACFKSENLLSEASSHKLLGLLTTTLAKENSPGYV